MVSPLNSSCCGVTFPCKVCNINQKGVAEVPAYRVVLFWRILNHERRDLDNMFSCGWACSELWSSPWGIYILVESGQSCSQPQALHTRSAASLVPVSLQCCPLPWATPSLGCHTVERGPWLHIHSKQCPIHFINIREHRFCSQCYSSICLCWVLKCC